MIFEHVCIRVQVIPNKKWLIPQGVGQEWKITDTLEKWIKNDKYDLHRGKMWTSENAVYGLIKWIMGWGGTDQE